MEPPRVFLSLSYHKMCHWKNFTQNLSSLLFFKAHTKPFNLSKIYLPHLQCHFWQCTWGKLTISDGLSYYNERWLLRKTMMIAKKLILQRWKSSYRPKIIDVLYQYMTNQHSRIYLSNYRTWWRHLMQYGLPSERYSMWLNISSE